MQRIFSRLWSSAHFSTSFHIAVASWLMPWPEKNKQQRHSILTATEMEVFSHRSDSCPSQKPEGFMSTSSMASCRTTRPPSYATPLQAGEPSCPRKWRCPGSTLTKQVGMIISLLYVPVLDLLPKYDSWLLHFVVASGNTGCLPRREARIQEPWTAPEGVQIQVESRRYADVSPTGLLLCLVAT